MMWNTRLIIGFVKNNFELSRLTVELFINCTFLLYFIPLRSAMLPSILRIWPLFYLYTSLRAIRDRVKSSNKILPSGEKKNVKLVIIIILHREHNEVAIRNFSQFDGPQQQSDQASLLLLDLYMKFWTALHRPTL